MSPSEVENNFDAQINRDLDVLSDGPLSIEGDTLFVRLDEVTPLIALATDAIVRYEYDPDGAISYLIDLLNLSA